MKRLLTAAALVPPVLYTVLGGPGWLFFAVVSLAAVVCYAEYDTIAGRYGFGRPGPLGYGAGILVLLLPLPDGLTAIVLATLLALVFSLRAGDLGQSLPRASLFALGMVYIFGCWKFAIPIRATSPHWMMYALLLNWIGDTGAYYAGRAFGRHRMSPRVSPKKTWEGAGASVIAATLAGTAYLVYFVPGVQWIQVAALTVVANIAGQVGDLAESAMKRGAGVKDSGTILPGHGGLLDRVDSTLFTLPVVYLYLRIFG